MEIVGINGKLSGPGKVALNVRPKLTPELFAEIRNISVTPLLANLSFENVGGCLVFYCSGGVTEHIRTNIEAMLSAAEAKAQETAKIKREQAEAQATFQQSKKNEAIKSASEIFRVPIQ